MNQSHASAPAHPAAGDQAPDDFAELSRLIEARGGTLPKRLRQVARFAVDHPDEVTFGTVASIAERANVQPSAVVRFAQAMGFSGFSQMQALFRERLRGGFPDYSARVAALDGQGRPNPATLLEGFTACAVDSLERMRMSLAPETLERSVETLARADTIYLIGVRRVFPVVVYLAYAFGQLGLRSVLVDHIAQLGPEQIGFAGPRDAALVVSFAPYASMTLDLTRAAGGRGAKIVAITDSPLSPLVQHAQAWIEVAEADFSGFRSLSASLALALTLAVATADRRRADGPPS